MRRMLSSRRTFYIKYVFPALWLTLWTAGTVMFFILSEVATTEPNGPGPPPPEAKWGFLAITVWGGFSFYRGWMRVKRVEMDDAALYVSNFVREIRVPLGDIEDVKESNRWTKGWVTVEFRRETEFGLCIIFIPKLRTWGFWRAHPVVAELRAASRHARGLPPELPVA